MKARQQAPNIDVSSVIGCKIFSKHATYCDTKFMVHAINKNLNKEVTVDNVRVISIAPGKWKLNYYPVPHQVILNWLNTKEN